MNSKIGGRRRHKRGRKFEKKGVFTVDFLNVRGIYSKIHEINKHLSEGDVKIFGMAETFLKTDDRPAKLNPLYNWIGKCREKPKGKGGIRAMYQVRNSYS